jgi:riboflavin kinase / FMN hydrolase
MQDFYGDELRLVVCGYIRPEADFTTLNALRERIHQDADIARLALLTPAMWALQADSFLLPAVPGVMTAYQGCSEASLSKAL